MQKRYHAGMSRLIGSDGGAFTTTVAAAAVAGSASTVVGAWYQIREAGTAGPFSIAGSVGTADNYSGDLGVGDLFYSRQAVAIPASNGDMVHLVTFPRVASVSGWNFGITRPEIDLTTIEDKDRVYRFGRNEWSGEINGVFDQAVKDLYSRVVRSIEFGTAAPGSAAYEDTVDPIASSEFPFVGVLDTGRVDGITFVFIEAVSLGGYGFGATDGQRQEWTAPLRIADGSLRCRRPSTSSLA